MHLFEFCNSGPSGKIQLKRAFFPTTKTSPARANLIVVLHFEFGHAAENTRHLCVVMDLHLLGKQRISVGSLDLDSESLRVEFGRTANVDCVGKIGHAS